MMTLDGIVLLNKVASGSVPGAEHVADLAQAFLDALDGPQQVKTQPPALPASTRIIVARRRCPSTRSNGSGRRIAVGPTPPALVLAELKRELSETLRLTNAVPIALSCESWTLGKNEFVAQVRLAVCDGELNVPFAQWYEWQHPAWRWASLPPSLTLETES